ncbi:MAG TPA: TetR/AcrR family transcriptional regulator [Gemmatimonadaceae bacterium]|jgi:AcrR family transcriptional regulator|nr:TetR/AcrR family transcriptional regulator [Gemmatimonadaceae bacterium]
MTGVVRPGRPRSGEVDQAVLSVALDLVTTVGFRAVTIEGIAARAGVAKTTIYRRWPNRAAVVMDAFMVRVGSHTLFSPDEPFLLSVRHQMRTMAKAFRGEDGALVKALLAESQFDPELASAFRERWILPRRAMALAHFRSGVDQGAIRRDADLEATIDLLYAPIYYRLQMGTGPLSNTYIDSLFDHVMQGVRG